MDWRQVYSLINRLFIDTLTAKHFILLNEVSGWAEIEPSVGQFFRISFGPNDWEICASGGKRVSAGSLPCSCADAVNALIQTLCALWGKLSANLENDFW